MEKIFERIVTSIYALAGTLLFAVALITMGLSIWDVATHFTSVEALTAPLLHSIGAIVISIAIIDVARYVFEQEVLKHKQDEWGPPVAATETLKKMFVIISIAISLEGLVYIFKAGAEDISLLLYPALVIVTSVLAMVGLGLYQWLVSKAVTAPTISPPNK
jgi:type IV secretory pathway TrbD component